MLTTATRRNLLLAAALLAATGYAGAQTEVKRGVMQGKDYGVTYFLPRTVIEIQIDVTRHTRTPGEFCKYAGRYLRMPDVPTQPQTYWTLDEVRANVAGVPDKEHVYFVKLKDKTTAPLMELTRDGIVRTINYPYGWQAEKPETPTAPRTDDTRRLPDPRSFLTEEILMSSSTAKMAELVAKEIYNIRDSKNALLRGEADYMPQDGAQLKLMLDNLTAQEEAMTQMFSGTVNEEHRTVSLRLEPQETRGTVAFRFSQKLGILGSDDLSGDPIYLSLTNLHTVAATPEDKKKDPEGIAYNAPGRAHLRLYDLEGNTLCETECPISQFGTVEYLAPVLFNKNAPTKVLFDTDTGGLLKVERE